jgi:hypothetical protein
MEKMLGKLLPSSEFLFLFFFRFLPCQARPSLFGAA